jgi:8-oxo-dGTP diphosphatase
MNKQGKYVYDWPRPMVTVDAVVFAVSGNTVKLLLIKRKNDPFKGQWAFPGGFIGIDEELDVAVARELSEETGLTGVKLEQMHTFGKPGRDPRGRQITVAYMGIITDGFDRIQAGDDAEQAQWFDINNLPSNMAFDHVNVAKFAIDALRLPSVTSASAKEGAASLVWQQGTKSQIINHKS